MRQRHHVTGGLFSALKSFEVQDQRQLKRSVLGVALLVTGTALAVDVMNQLIFFVSWQAALRSWMITVLLAGALSTVIAYFFAKAQLQLFVSKQEIERLSRLDHLTGLQNRRALLEWSEVRCETMVLVIVDIDRFKRVNDTHGHLVGDEVIRSVARVMDSELGELGHLGRLGGEEFALLSSSYGAADVLAKLSVFRSRMASVPMIIGDVVVTVTISAGMAQRGPAQSFIELYAEADQALYAAKAAGRNCIRLSPSLQDLRLPEDWPAVDAG